ncbi:MAG TPA: L,D-transpeptidase family protein [Gammaproteobacteria bacterium]|nr:L,D-transpeptidase family protein [Gammaproteobacteria bacterium]
MLGRIALHSRFLRNAALSVLALVPLGGCALLSSTPPEAPPAPAPAVVAVPDPRAPRLTPLDTRKFELAANQEIIGETQVLFSHYEDTFAAIARVYDLGYEELRVANPTVDKWLPGVDTPVYLPTQTILPDAPRKGIVINVPAMRLFYFETTTPKGSTAKAPAKKTVADAAPAQKAAPEPAAKAEGVAAAVTPAVAQKPLEPALPSTTVTSYPIGIGAEGWATPFGEAKVTGKAKDPVWYPPASVRKEHADRGDPLPSVVKAGPDNPLGRYALTLSLPSYLIHGTNTPAGVGMRSSHGCIRLYPEDIEALFGRIAKGTPVRLVNQPVLAAWQGNNLYLEVHPPLAEEDSDLLADAERALAAALERAGSAAGAAVDHELVARIVTEKRGIPFPVLRSAPAPERYLASVRHVENTVPVVPADKTARTEGSAVPAAPSPR